MKTKLTLLMVILSLLGCSKKFAAVDKIRKIQPPVCLTAGYNLDITIFNPIGVGTLRCEKAEYIYTAKKTDREWTRVMIPHDAYSSDSLSQLGWFKDKKIIYVSVYPDGLDGVFIHTFHYEAQNYISTKDYYIKINPDGTCNFLAKK